MLNTGQKNGAKGPLQDLGSVKPCSETAFIKYTASNVLIGPVERAGICEQDNGLRRGQGPVGRTWTCQEGCHFIRLICLINFFLNKLQICSALLHLVSTVFASLFFMDICRHRVKSKCVSTKRKIEFLSPSDRRKPQTMTEWQLHFRL